MPVVEILEAALAQAGSREVFRQRLGDDAAELARLMPQLRRIFTDIPPPLELSPEHSRRILFSGVAEVLVRAAGSRPLLLLIEDLHWADEGTLSLLHYLARSVPKIPAMIVGTYRDDEVNPGGGLAKVLEDFIRLHLVERITLQGLPQNAVAEMIEALSGREPPDTLVTLIYSSTEGNPFYIEELYRHLVERGKLIDPSGAFHRGLDLEDVDLPQNLRLVISRRLARLSEETLKTLGTAAVIGRSFTFELLEAATRTEADWLLDRVEEAEKAGLISSTVQYPDARFRFSHDLIRRTVLGDLSAPRRQQLNLRIADAIERVYAGVIEEHANDLAHHLQQAGNAAEPGRTLKYLAMAAARELSQGAYEGALRHLQSALEFFRRVPDSAQHSELELELQINYGVALLATQGWYVPEAGNAYKRARALCPVGDPRLFSVLSGLFSYHLVKGEHPIAFNYSDELLALTAGAQNDGLLVEACSSSGLCKFFMGEFTAAHATFERGIEHYDRRKHRKLALMLSLDPCVTCLCYDAMTLRMLGYPDQAEKKAIDSLALARNLADQFTLTWCLANLGFYHAIFHDFSIAERFIVEGTAIAKEHGFTFYETLLAGYQSIVSVAKGESSRPAESGRSQRLSDPGYDLAGTWARTELAEALGNRGKHEIAMTLLAQASALVERNEERFVESEIHRVTGELTFSKVNGASATRTEIQAAQSAAEQSFLKAIDIARRRSAKTLEIRAATGLARLLASTGRQAEGCLVLQKTYDSFTEGFEAAELKIAKSLLEKLATVPAQGRRGSRVSV